jgi:hypothetical protein
MIRFIYSTAFLLFFFFSVQGQDQKETFGYFSLIRAILSSEQSGDTLVYRLDTLKSKFIPSRSYVTDHFNRYIDFGFKHRSISVSLNFASFRVDLLCRHDTIYLSSLSSATYESMNYEHYDKAVIDNFLKKRNRFYRSSKTPQQLMEELALPVEYAFYCGDGMPKTEKGKYIEQLVDDENTATLMDMLKSFNCETQAYGVAGIEMLERRGYQVPYDIQNLVNHIKKRNSELVICSGCLSGIEKIYNKK